MRPIPFALLLSILAANSLLPQQKPQQANPAQPAAQAPAPAKFSTSIITIFESVSVKDKSGKPIEGLKKEDFVVTEDNVPQSINFFEYQKMEDEVLPTIAAPSAAAPIPAEKEKPKAVESVVRTEIAPEVSGDLKYRDKRLLCLYFDMTSMRRSRPVPRPRCGSERSSPNR